MSMVSFYLKILLFSIVAIGIFFIPTLVLNSFGVIISLLTLITVLSPWNAFFELLSNFHPQLLIISLLFLILSFMAGYFRLATLFAVCACVHIYAMKDVIFIPYTAKTEIQGNETTSLRVMTLDMQNTQTEIKKLKDRLEDEKPTVIALSNIPKDSTSLMDGLKAEYPYTLIEEEKPPFNGALLSKWPLQNTRIERITQTIKDGENAVVPILTADLCTPNNNQKCVSLLSIITPNILCEPAYLLQQKILRRASQMVLEDQKNPVIVMGDFHITPWTFTFKTFLQNTHLRNSALGFPWRTTWQFRSPLVGLSFDHILVSKNIGVSQWWVADSVGSDHYPVFADLTINWASSAPQELTTRTSTPFAGTTSSPQ